MNVFLVLVKCYKYTVNKYCFVMGSAENFKVKIEPDEDNNNINTLDIL